MSSSTGSPHPSRDGGPYTGMPAVLARAAWQPLAATGVAACALRALGMAWSGFTLLAVGVLIVSPFRSLARLTLVAGLWLMVLGVIEIAHGIQLRVHDRQPT